jgi:hypothetical protein
MVLAGAHVTLNRRPEMPAGDKLHMAHRQQRVDAKAYINPGDLVTQSDPSGKNGVIFKCSASLA